MIEARDDLEFLEDLDSRDLEEAREFSCELE